MANEFGSVRFDPEVQKEIVDQEEDAKTLTEPEKVGFGKSSSKSRARSSTASWRASMQREQGWDMRKSNALSSMGSLAEGDGDDIDYNTLKWWQAGFIMIAETISLGILSLPSVLARVGMLPGIILIAGFGVIATYSGYVIGQFRLRYPWVHSFGDAGEILGEPIGAGAFFRELLGWAQTIFQIFTMASHILTWTICLNTITDSATCTMVWGVIGLGIFWVLDLPRTLAKVSYMSIASFVSIFSAVFVTMIDVGIEKPIGSGSLRALPESISFTTAFLSVSNITFAFAGHSCFFGFIAEMREPRDWPKALAMLQICDTSLYLTAAIVIYRYTGSEVASPALGSAGPLVKKVTWGLAIPTIIIAGVIYGHIAAKYIFVRLFRGTKHMNKRTKLSTIAWFSLTGAIWVIAWIIAESIPNFNDLLALISALFASWFTFGIPGMLWLHMTWGGNDTDNEKGDRTGQTESQTFRTKAQGWFKDWKRCCLFAANVSLVAIGTIICVLGLWSSGEAIHNATGGASWTCQSNAQ